MTDLIKLSDAQTPAELQPILSLLKDEASKRRRKKTPKTIRKKLDVGSGRQVDIVDRAEYQRFLDDSFPGWSVTDVKFWTESVTTKDGTFPMLFNCSLTLAVLEGAGVVRKVVGVGSAPVNKSEVTRDTTTLLRHKYSTAYTNAMKTACGWLGAFFDLRADDEEREAAQLPPSEEQDKEYASLLKQFDPAHHAVIDRGWSQQTRKSAVTYLQQMREKIESMNKLKEETA